MDFLNKHVLVIGLGKSGKAASLKLKDLGANVLASDISESEDMMKLADELRAKGISVELGKQEESLLRRIDRIDIIVVSPGVPSKVPVLKAAEKLNIPVWSEIELAYKLANKPIIAITGTNGKTTTTTLIGEVFRAAGKKVAVAGNIGMPLVMAADDPAIETLIVEVSSFQLDTIVDFRPNIAVLLNITEDHLDWHPDFEDYVRSKSRLFLNQQDSDFAVLNLDDRIVSSLVSGIRANIISTSKQKLEKGVFIDGDRIVAKLPSVKAGSEDTVDICGISELKVRGSHNLDNVMAVIGACLAAGIDYAIIRDVITSFPGLEHRTEYVATINGVDYFNDSKATNVDATVKALTAFDSSIILLVGGRNKGNDFKPLAQSLSEQVKAVIGFGESGREILGTITANIYLEYAETVEEAVKLASKLAQPGQVVLFSPSCASFDAFRSYAHRGEVFKRAVQALGEGYGDTTN
ncbi:MAG: UDP-N-acetylmuramoyl-L-alanine--D-glutamate ligase [Firmicutes bacterium]|nr:UDP-N-acetylmuramoyl-L-alanine--D-glutamate ligase [Bacillota bacterium]